MFDTIRIYNATSVSFTTLIVFGVGSVNIVTQVTALTDSTLLRQCCIGFKQALLCCTVVLH